MRKHLLLFLVLVGCLTLSGQDRPFGPTRLALPGATTLPAACTANIEVYIDTNATPAGQQVYLCNSGGNGWNLIGDGFNNTFGFSFVLADPADADDGDLQHKLGFAYTVVRMSCSTDTGSVGINVDERAEATPNTAGTNVLSSSLVCDTNSQTSCASGCDVNTITNGTIDADDPMGLILAAPSGSPTVVRVHVEATKD